METGSTIRRLLNSLFRLRRLITPLFLSIMVTIIAGSLVWPPRYEAWGTVIIKGRSYENVLFGEERRGGPRVSDLKTAHEINTEIQIIRSRPVLEYVVRTLKLDIPRKVQGVGYVGAVRRWIHVALRQARALPEKIGLRQELPGQEAFESAVDQLGKEIVIEPATDSQIVRIGYRDRDPVMASQVVNAVIEEYLRQHLAINTHRAQATFFEEQIQRLEAELAPLQRQLEMVMSEEGIIDFAEQGKALIKTIESFELARATTQKEIISRKSKIVKVRQQLKSDPDYLVPLPEIAQYVHVMDLQNKLTNAKYLLETTRQRFTDSSRQVVTVREQIKEITALLRDEVNQFLRREEADLEKLQSEEAALSRTTNVLKSDIKQLPAKQTTLTNLQRRIEDRQTTLDLLRKRYQDSLVAQASDWRLEEAKIVSSAAPPQRPVVPNHPLNFGLGLVLASVLSISVAFCVDYWDDSLRMPEDVERRLGLPVLASIPEL